MITKYKEYWKGSEADDITEYLKQYSGNPRLDVKDISCRSCDGDVFIINCDADECAIQVKCTRCGKAKFIADSAEYWDDAQPETVTCPICGGSAYNAKIGFERADSGRIKWIYIGIRCAKCGALGSPLDWSIDYDPDEELDKNI